MQAHYDVAVVGGGTAGIIAAVQAARAGAQTLLVEKTGQLGGTITNAEIANPGLFHAWGRQIIAGIGWELVTTAAAESGTALYDPQDWTEHAWRQCVRLNPTIFAAIADAAVLDAGVDLHLHTMAARAADAGDGWNLTFCTKTGLVDTTAAAVIDATADANVVALAGGPVEATPAPQTATLNLHTHGVDLEGVDLDAVDAAFAAEVDAGRMAWTDVGSSGIGASGLLKRGGRNTMHLPAPDAHTSAGRTRVEVAARAIARKLQRFYRAQPGLEDLQITAAVETGIRETVGIRGRATVTAEDYLSGRLWPDAVCYSYWPIDLHLDDPHRWVDVRPLEPHTFPTIPRGALLPAGMRNLIVPGRAAAGDREARSAFRIQATCMAMGQAAGAMAVLAARTGAEAAALPLDDLRDLLSAHGAIVPGEI